MIEINCTMISQVIDADAEYSTSHQLNFSHLTSTKMDSGIIIIAENCLAIDEILFGLSQYLTKNQAAKNNSDDFKYKWCWIRCSSKWYFNKILATYSNYQYYIDYTIHWSSKGMYVVYQDNFANKNTSKKHCLVPFPFQTIDDPHLFSTSIDHCRKFDRLGCLQIHTKKWFSFK